jgi:hypothetical protein
MYRQEVRMTTQITTINFRRTSGSVETQHGRHHVTAGMRLFFMR